MKTGLAHVAPCERHIVLVQPEIHWNTGNIGRTCLGAGAALHLIRPLGFSTESRQVRRAGLDYWENVDVTIWDHFDCFVESISPAEGEIRLFTKNGSIPFWNLGHAKRMILVFGSETGGLPIDLLDRYKGFDYFIPMTGAIRSLNLSTAVGIALYESLRHQYPVPV